MRQSLTAASEFISTTVAPAVSSGVERASEFVSTSVVPLLRRWKTYATEVAVPAAQTFVTETAIPAVRKGVNEYVVPAAQTAVHYGRAVLVPNATVLLNHYTRGTPLPAERLEWAIPPLPAVVAPSAEEPVHAGVAAPSGLAEEP